MNETIYCALCVCQEERSPEYPAPNKANTRFSDSVSEASLALICSDSAFAMLWNLVEPRGHSDTVETFGSNETLVGSHGMMNPGRNLLQVGSSLPASTDAARIPLRHWLVTGSQLPLGMALLQDGMLQRMQVHFVLTPGMQVDKKA